MKDRSFRIRGEGEKGVLLIHGLTGAPSEMKSVGRVLHKRGFGLYAPMLAGHGGTEADLLKTDWRDWVDSASQAYLDFAREVDEVYVAGICAGGAIGLDLGIFLLHLGLHRVGAGLMQIGLGLFHAGLHADAHFSRAVADIAGGELQQLFRIGDDQLQVAHQFVLVRLRQFFRHVQLRGWQ